MIGSSTRRTGTHLGRLNNRTHRKLLVVDGRDRLHRRRRHRRRSGPATRRIPSTGATPTSRSRARSSRRCRPVFMDNWIKATGEVLHGAEYFPTLAAGRRRRGRRCSAARRRGGSESMELMYLLSITAAASGSIRPLERRTSCRTSSPRDAMIDALQARRASVQIITPGEHIDAETVRSASRARWGELLAAGAEIYEYQPTMYHCKVMIVDELLVSVGSTNFDDRSFRLNDEANLSIYDRVRAPSEATSLRRCDLDDARAASTLAEWQARPLRERPCSSGCASLLGSQLWADIQCCARRLVPGCAALHTMVCAGQRRRPDGAWRWQRRAAGGCWPRTSGPQTLALDRRLARRGRRRPAADGRATRCRAASSRTTCRAWLAALRRHILADLPRQARDQRRRSAPGRATRRTACGAGGRAATCTV